MIPGNCANCLRTSLTTSCAVAPTARQVQDEKRNTRVAPSNPPMNTSGTAISTCLNGIEVNAETSSRYAEKSKKEAKPAEPMA